ncbi:hypothetical protein ACLOJK_031809 [Asimina triloba]
MKYRPNIPVGKGIMCPEATSIRSLRIGLGWPTGIFVHSVVGQAQAEEVAATAIVFVFHFLVIMAYDFELMATCRMQQYLLVFSATLDD